VVAFRRDPDALWAALDAGKAGEELAEGEHYLLLTAVGAGRVEMTRLTAAQGRALRGEGGAVAEVWAAGWVV
jgi:hypothetical protein